MSRTDTTALADRLEPARDRVGAATAQARERARSGLDLARVRAAEAATEARERAAEVAEQLEPTTSRLAGTTGTVLRRGVGAAAVLPDVVASLLRVVSRLLSGLAEQGRGVAARVEPPRGERRRRRIRTAGWFGAGFAAGAVAGWVVHARLREEPAPPFEDRDPAPPASASDDRPAEIDARRHNTPVG